MNHQLVPLGRSQRTDQKPDTPDSNPRPAHAELASTHTGDGKQASRWGKGVRLPAAQGQRSREPRGEGVCELNPEGVSVLTDISPGFQKRGGNEKRTTAAKARSPEDAWLSSFCG